MATCKECGVWQDHLGRHLGKNPECQRAYYLVFEARPDDDDDDEGGQQHGWAYAVRAVAPLAAAPGGGSW